MTENQLVVHLAEALIAAYPDGDASETMAVERVLEALRSLPEGDRMKAVGAVGVDVSMDGETYRNDGVAIVGPRPRLWMIEG